LYLFARERHQQTQEPKNRTAGDKRLPSLRDDHSDQSAALSALHERTFGVNDGAVGP
jgi:hypothetical protein